METDTTLSDEELLRLMRAGDESAFVSLYRRRQRNIYRFAWRMSGSEAVAEDVTQEVFMTLISEKGKYDSARGSLQAYLYGIARYQVLRRIEKDRPLTQIGAERRERMDHQAQNTRALPNLSESGLEAIASFDDPLCELTRREVIDSVRQAVLSLPSHYREVVILCDLHELSYAETSQALGCAIGTVRSRLHRARRLLLEKLSGQELRQTDFADSLL